MKTKLPKLISAVVVAILGVSALTFTPVFAEPTLEDIVNEYPAVEDLTEEESDEKTRTDEDNNPSNRADTDTNNNNNNSGSGNAGGSTSASDVVTSLEACDKLQGVARDAAGCSGTAKDQLPITVQNILSAIIVITGIVAVGFIVVGGIGFMTAAGDPAKVKKAKDTILYACIGLVICALAFVIVNWAIDTIEKSNTSNIQESSEDTGSDDSE